MRYDPGPRARRMKFASRPITLLRIGGGLPLTTGAPEKFVSRTSRPGHVCSATPHRTWVFTRPIVQPVPLPAASCVSYLIVRIPGGTVRSIVIVDHVVWPSLTV